MEFQFVCLLSLTLFWWYLFDRWSFTVLIHFFVRIYKRSWSKKKTFLTQKSWFFCVRCVTFIKSLKRSCFRFLFFLCSEKKLFLFCSFFDKKGNEKCVDDDNNWRTLETELTLKVFRGKKLRLVTKSTFVSIETIKWSLRWSERLNKMWWHFEKQISFNVTKVFNKKMFVTFVY